MRVYEPRSGQKRHEAVGLVVFNQYGATADQDTGRDAQHLADVFGAYAIAVDRPGTGRFIPSRQLARRLSTPDGYLAEMAKLGKDIDRQVESLGLKRIIATGRSAGGLGALALVRAEVVSTATHLFAAEPVGCEDVSVAAGTRRYAAYNAEQRRLILTSPNEQLVKPLPPGLPVGQAVMRLVSIPPAALLDKYHNESQFATDAAVQYAAHVARYQPEVDATLEFAEHSLVATPEVYAQRLAPLVTLRDRQGAPFEVRQSVRTVHASYDNREYMASALRPTVERAFN